MECRSAGRYFKSHYARSSTHSTLIAVPYFESNHLCGENGAPLMCLSYRQSMERLPRSLDESPPGHDHASDNGLHLFTSLQSSAGLAAIAVGS